VDLATWKRYGKGEYDEYTDEQLLSVDIRAFASQNSKPIKYAWNAINTAIDSVFPLFAPFSSKPQKRSRTANKRNKNARAKRSRRAKSGKKKARK
jgi:hypothetical protein